MLGVKWKVEKLLRNVLGMGELTLTVGLKPLECSKGEDDKESCWEGILPLFPYFPLFDDHALVQSVGSSASMVSHSFSQGMDMEARS